MICRLISNNFGQDSEKDIYLTYLAGESHCVAMASRILVGLRSPDPNMRMVAAKALGMVGQKDAIAALSETLSDPIDDIRDAAKYVFRKDPGALTRYPSLQRQRFRNRAKSDDSPPPVEVETETETETETAEVLSA